MDKVLMILRKDCEEIEKKYNSSLFSIDITCDVITGLQKVNDEKPKLIIIDMASSRISGNDLVRIIRSNPSNYHSKIIITSKNYNFKFIHEAFELGADYFIKFPFKIEEIERIYTGLKALENYMDLEAIAKSNGFEWLSGI